MIITGHLRSFFNAMLYFLSCQNVLLKDYGSYAQGITDGIKAHVQKYTDSLSRPLVYLNSPKTSKEQTTLKCLQDSPVTECLICTISTVEMCNAFSAVPNKTTHKLEIKCMKRKCLHYYFYYLDKVYGLMFVKLQTWFPFTVTVYINGRELMKKVFDENHIAYSMYDNSFFSSAIPAKHRNWRTDLIPKNFPNIWTSLLKESIRFSPPSKIFLAMGITGVPARLNTPPTLCFRTAGPLRTYTPSWWAILFMA